MSDCEENKVCEENQEHYMTDDDWTEYVLSLLDEDQLYNGYPKVDGLRRVMGKLGFIILDSEVSVIQAPNENNNYTATVEYCIRYNTDETQYKSSVTYRDVADASKGEFGPPFNKHITAIAATRAEGRTIRKLLRLKNVLTHEEKDLDENIEKENNDRAGSQQVQVIKMMCGKRDLNLDKVAQMIVKKDFDDCKFSDCQEIIKEMNNKKSKVKFEECGV